MLNDMTFTLLELGQKWGCGALVADICQKCQEILIADGFYPEEDVYA